MMNMKQWSRAAVGAGLALGLAAQAQAQAEGGCPHAPPPDTDCPHAKAMREQQQTVDPSAGPPAEGVQSHPYQCHADGQPNPKSEDGATMHHRFDDPEHWAKRFDDPSRDEWQKPGELVRALGIKAGQTVFEIGAGTGYFSQWYAGAVGPQGTVFAMDIEPNLVAYLQRRAEREGTPQVTPVLGSPNNPRMPAGVVDWIVTVNTYHHIDARKAYFRELAERAKPATQLAVIDFRQGNIPVGPPESHRIPPEKVQSELEQAGWKLSREVKGIVPYQFVLVFARQKKLPIKQG